MDRHTSQKPLGQKHTAIPVMAVCFYGVAGGPRRSFETS